MSFASKSLRRCNHAPFAHNSFQKAYPSRVYTSFTTLLVPAATWIFADGIPSPADDQRENRREDVNQLGGRRASCWYNKEKRDVALWEGRKWVTRRVNRNVSCWKLTFPFVLFFVPRSNHPSPLTQTFHLTDRFRSRSRNELFSFHRSNKIFCTISILILKFRRACKNYLLITRGLKIRSFFIYIKMFEGSFFFLSEKENYAIYNPRYYNPFFFSSILLFIRNQFYPKGVSYF